MGSCYQDGRLPTVRKLGDAVLVTLDEGTYKGRIHSIMVGGLQERQVDEKYYDGVLFKDLIYTIKLDGSRFPVVVNKNEIKNLCDR